MGTDITGFDLNLIGEYGHFQVELDKFNTYSQQLKSLIYEEKII